MFNIKNYQTDNIKNDILSGLVVAVALVPEAIAFSFIVGVNPIVGLYTAFILGLITSIFGGKPGMISGATGSVAVVLVGLAIEASKYLKEHGATGDDLALGVISFIALSAILAGIFQMLFGFLRLGKFKNSLFFIVIPKTVTAFLFISNAFDLSKPSSLNSAIKFKGTLGRVK